MDAPRKTQARINPMVVCGVSTACSPHKAAIVINAPIVNDVHHARSAHIVVAVRIPTVPAIAQSPKILRLARMW